MRLVILLPLLLVLAPAQDEEDVLNNWHQFRGPTGNGTAPKGKPPTKWGEDQNIKWKVEIPGRGLATPIIWKDKIFLLAAIKTDKRAEGGEEEDPPRRRRGIRPPTNFYESVVMCLSRKNGKVLWKKVADESLPHEGLHPDSTYASATPVTDGKHLFASFGSRGLYCYDLEGELKWKRDFGRMSILRKFGEGISPVLHGDSLIHLWDHEGASFIVCLDKKTGKDKWKVKREEGTTWQTPLIVKHDGVTQVITNGVKRSRSYDIETGKLLWECGGMTSNPIPSPVSDDGVVYLMTGFHKYSINAVSLDARGDVTGKEEVLWNNKDAAPYVASPLLYDGLLYVTKFNSAVLSCIEAKTGKVHYAEERLPGLRNLYASIAGADGKVYITGRAGTTLVLKHGKEFKVLATNKLEDRIDASPVIVGRELYLRGKKFLYCITEKREY